MISILVFLIGLASGIYLFTQKQSMSGLLVALGFFLFSISPIVEFVALRLLYNRVLYYDGYREEMNQVLDYVYLCISTPAFFCGSIVLLAGIISITSSRQKTIVVNDSNHDVVVNVPNNPQNFIATDKDTDFINKSHPLSNSKDAELNDNIDNAQASESNFTQNAHEDENATTSHPQNSIDIRKTSRDATASFLIILRKLTKLFIRSTKYVKSQINNNFNQTKIEAAIIDSAQIEVLAKSENIDNLKSNQSDNMKNEAIENQNVQKVFQNKICPYCAEEVKEEAVVCKYCGKNIDAESIRVNSKEYKAEQARINTKNANTFFLILAIFIFLTSPLWCKSVLYLIIDLDEMFHIF